PRLGGLLRAIRSLRPSAPKLRPGLRRRRAWGVSLITQAHGSTPGKNGNRHERAEAEDVEAGVVDGQRHSQRYEQCVERPRTRPKQREDDEGDERDYGDLEVVGLVDDTAPRKMEQMDEIGEHTARAAPDRGRD